MPIYAYRCSNCGCEQDVLQKISDARLTTCPECHEESFTKQLSAPGFQLKGSGWYATDFKGGAAPAKTEAKAETKAEAKPEAKTETPSCQGGGSCACH